LFADKLLQSEDNLRLWTEVGVHQVHDVNVGLHCCWQVTTPLLCKRTCFFPRKDFVFQNLDFFKNSTFWFANCKKFDFQNL